MPIVIHPNYPTCTKPRFHEATPEHDSPSLNKIKPESWGSRLESLPGAVEERTTTMHGQGQGNLGRTTESEAGWWFQSYFCFH